MNSPVSTDRAIRFCLLVGLWLAAYKLATLLDIFRPYSSVWFLPAGVTLSIIIAAPGWLKFAPLAANLLLVVPEFAQFFVEDNGGGWVQVLHAVRHCGIYGLMAFLLRKAIPVGTSAIALKSIFRFLVLAVVAAALAGITGVCLHALAGNFSWHNAWSIVVQWAVGDAIAAIVLPPVLVPLLLLVFGRAMPGWRWPAPRPLLVHALLIAVTLALGSQAHVFNTDLGSLWYLVLIPPIIAGVVGGFPLAAASTFITTLTTPLAAFFLAYPGEIQALALLLLIGAIAALLIGAAVSDQREALETVEAERRSLAAAVALRTSELTEAHDFQRHLVRSIGHDLRQPLQTMILLLDFMKLNEKADPAIIDQTQSVGLEMAGFLDGVLNSARLDPGSVRPSLNVFPARRVFERLVTIYGPLAQQRNVALVIDDSQEIVAADEQLLLQALANDLDNAIRNSTAGMRIVLRHESDGERELFLVEDEVNRETTAIGGAAGFGRAIVERVAGILGAERIEENNRAGLALRSIVPANTP